MDYSIFFELAIILVVAKLMAIGARRLKAPQVVGEIIAGLIIGPSVLGIVRQTDFITNLAGIGVVLLMFQAGLETNLRELLHTGPKALAIACTGVFVPLVGGTLLYMGFYGFAPVGDTEFFRALFIGVILTATSVSITVATLKEMGKLRSTLGTTIVSAAIIDDVIGILVLTVVLSLGGGETVSIQTVVLKILLFFVFIAIFGVLCYFVFRWMDSKWPHTQRIPIFSLAVCFFLAFAAEHFFGVADITGAYAAGVILCSIRDADYIDTKMNISSYMLFGPVFFASIGLKTDIHGFSSTMLLFSLGFVVVGLLAKIIGCGLAGLATRHKPMDSLRIGVGMMTRGEVALIVTQKGLSTGIIEANFFTPVILLILVSSVMTPVVLKRLFREKDTKTDENGLAHGA
jgi:Kef-type K+ transport system membrane component KefB